MRIVMTGGTGFVGEGLVPELLRAGHEVVLLSRGPVRRVPEGVTMLQWDGEHGGEWERAVDGADAVVNFAGESIGHRWTSARKQRIRASRQNATCAIVEAIRKARQKPSVLVNASAVGYYGNIDEGEVTETFPPGKDFLAETCHLWETAALGARESGVRVVLLRTGVVLGKGGDALHRMMLPFRFFVGGTIGSGRQWFPWVHRDDLVRAVLFVIGTPALSGPVNVTSPAVVRMRDFCSDLGKAMHRPSWAPAPAFMLRMILGEMSAMILGGQCVVPTALLGHGFTFTHADLREALQDVVLPEVPAGL